MSAEPEAMTAPPAAAPAAATTRPYYWSVRRELWENRSIYLAPLVVSALVLLGLLFSTIGLPHRRLGVLAMAPDKQAASVSQPYEFAATAILIATLIVAMAYCLSSLHGERRDRTILFWKSLPVSDLTTVLAKATVPFVILPIVAAAAVLAVQMVMFAWVSAMLLASGMDPFAPPVGLAPMAVTLLYALVTHTLWYAPVYGWLMLVSGWTKRGAPFLWAFLPPLALGLFEKAAFNTSHLGGLLMDRLFGGVARAFDQPPIAGKGMPHLPSVGFDLIDPGRFLTSAGVWLGLVFAFACLAACVWQRRYRDPI